MPPGLQVAGGALQVEDLAFAGWFHPVPAPLRDHGVALV